MKPKQLVILLFLLAGAGLWAFVANKGPKGGADNIKAPGSKLLPEMAMESIAQVKLTGPESSVNLKKKDGNGEWTVVDRDGYPADFNKLRKIVKDISELEIVQTQKVGESQLGRVGLAAPDAEGDVETRGTRVEMFDGSGAEIATVLMGKKYSTGAEDPSTGGGNPTGRYVSSGTAGEVYVVSNVFWSLETEPKDWLDKESISVQKTKSITVDYNEADGDDFTLVREEENGEGKFASPKEGEELDSTKATGVLNALSSISFVDVLTGERMTDEVTGLSKPTKIGIETFEGFKYEVLVGKKGEGDRYPVSLSVNAEIAQERTPEADEAEDAKAAKDEAFQNTKTRLTEKLEKEKKLEGKVFLVENWAVNNVMKKRSELFKVEEAEGVAGAANAANPGVGALTPPISVPPGIAMPVEIKPDEGAAAPTKPKEVITAVTPPISVKDAIKKDEVVEPVDPKEEMKEEPKVPADPEAEKKAKEASEAAAKQIEAQLKEAAEQAEAAAAKEKAAAAEAPAPAPAPAETEAPAEPEADAAPTVEPTDENP